MRRSMFALAAKLLLPILAGLSYKWPLAEWGTYRGRTPPSSVR